MTEQVPGTLVLEYGLIIPGTCTIPTDRKLSEVRPRTSAWYQWYVDATRRNLIFPDLPYLPYWVLWGILPVKPAWLRDAGAFGVADVLMITYTENPPLIH
jgi:hypothetical protein